MIQRIDLLVWEEDAASLGDLAKQLLAERDEARQVAREFYRLLWPERAREWEKEYPWLK